MLPFSTVSKNATPDPCCSNAFRFIEYGSLKPENFAGAKDMDTAIFQAGKRKKGKKGHPKPEEAAPVENVQNTVVNELHVQAAKQVREIYRVQIKCCESYLIFTIEQRPTTPPSTSPTRDLQSSKSCICSSGCINSWKFR